MKIVITGHTSGLGKEIYNHFKMSFNRLKYDSEDSRLSQNSSAKAASYFTQPPILTTHCLQENPRIINQHNGVSMPRDVEWRFYTGPVDIESDLMGVHRVASRCPTKKYTPSNLDSLGNNDFEKFNIFRNKIHLHC